MFLDKLLPKTVLQKLTYCVLSGLLLALAWPTYGFPLLLFVGFVPLLLVEYQLLQENKKSSLVLGYAFTAFLVWNSITTFWIYYSTAFGMVFALLVNSLLMSLVFFLFHKVHHWSRNNRIAYIFLAGCWIGFEYMHLHWEFSWPWLNLGNGFATYYQWIQWYEYTGTFGGTLWVWLVNLLIFFSLMATQPKRIKILRAMAVSFVLLPIGVSYLIFPDYASAEAKEEYIETLILQPNINPYTEKYNTTDKRVGDLLLKLTEEKITPNTQLVLAPETVFADGTNIDSWSFSVAKRQVEQLKNKYPNTAFIGGISFYKLIKDEAKIEQQTNFARPGLWFNDYNSAIAVVPGREDAFYHKSKLVVGVENFPYQDWLKPILGNIMIDLGGTVAMKTTQPERSVFQLSDQTKVAPIICYESVYGEYVGGYVNNQAQILAIITNDAWWEDTQGHQQHLSYARLRAIEHRRAVVRSANTGISAGILPNGDSTQELGYEKQGSLLVNLPLENKITFYARFGDYIARIGIFIAIFSFLLALSQKLRDKKIK
ncbi:apolipoprotein N-acyltransferase [Mesonia sp. HuA40]|uniref:apolipoprotein N-acyltransferase n=1 Tax=Mesonia sp. HuA40 TaxID=2602761 RepID=UPI00210379A6|nr:apolipoprotein N-acyltransferase [Mesonia sp. HuA40]